MNYLIQHGILPNIPSIFDDLFFKDFFGDNFFNPLPTLKKIDYPCDIYTTDKGLNIDIAAVGLERSDIKIDIQEDVLTVSHNKSNKDYSYAYQGITKKSFNLAWRINEKFDMNKVDAKLDKGLLMISIPLAEPTPAAKKVEVIIN